MTVAYWGKTKIVNTTTTGNQQDSSVAVLDGGNIVVVWTDASGAKSVVKGQIFDTGGSPIGSEFTVSPALTGAQQYREPDVTAINGGGFEVTYTKDLGNSDYDIYGTTYSAAGVASAPVALYTPGQQQDFSHVTRYGAAFAVVFNEDVVQPNDVQIRTYNTSSVVQQDVIANTTPTYGGTQNFSSIAQLSNGNFVAAWQTNASTIAYRIYNSSGVAQTAQLTTGGAVSNELPQVLAYGSGFVIVWDETAQFPDTHQSAVMQSFNAAGAAQTGAIRMNPADGDTHYFADLTMLPDGNLFGAWFDNTTATWMGCEINPLTGAGGPDIAINPSAPATYSFNFDNNLSLATTTDGRVVATWTDTSGTGDGSNNGVMMQIIDPRGGLITGTNSGETLYGNDNSNDNMAGLSGNDTIYGMSGDDYINGGAGNDTMYGMTGNDTLIGGAGDDTGYAGVGDDQLFGEDGNDILWGEAGNDFLAGQGGNDTLLGQDGNDFLFFDQGVDIGYGGTGGDQFYWNSYTQGADIVQDFNRAEGDQIWFDHTGFGMPAGWNLSLGFNFFYGPGVSATQNTATVYFDTNNNILFFDIDGAGAGAATAITFLVGTPALQASDIHFV